MPILRIYANNTQALGQLLLAVRGTARDEEMKNTVGAGVADMWRQHLWARDQVPNRLGGKRTNYWKAAGDSVTFKPTARGVEVDATQIGLRMKFSGGTITPKNARALTVPIHADAHGKRAREFDDLFILKKKGQKKGEKREGGILARKRGAGIQAMYALRSRVAIRKDPTVTPPASAVTRTATQAAMAFLSGTGVTN